MEFDGGVEGAGRDWGVSASLSVEKESWWRIQDRAALRGPSLLLWFVDYGTGLLVIEKWMSMLGDVMDFFHVVFVDRCRMGF